MDEIEKGLKEFLDYWFAGFSCGIETWGPAPGYIGRPACPTFFRVFFRPTHLHHRFSKGARR